MPHDAPAAPVAPTPEPSDAHEAISEAISLFRLQHWQDEDGGLGLADALAHLYGDKDIGRAQEELDVLADAIWDALAPTQAAPTGRGEASDEQFWDWWRAVNKNVHTGDILKADIVLFGRTIARALASMQAEAPARPSNADTWKEILDNPLPADVAGFLEAEAPVLPPLSEFKGYLSPALRELAAEAPVAPQAEAIKELVGALIGLCEFSEAAGFPTERARRAIARFNVEGEAPATSKRAEDTMPPGWVQCPECLAGFPIEDGIKGGAPVAAEAAEIVRLRSDYEKLRRRPDALNLHAFGTLLDMFLKDYARRGAAPQAPAQPEALTVDEIHDCADEAIGCHDACASDEMVERLCNFAKAIERAVLAKIKPQPEGEREILSTYEKLHEGKLGAHWLWVVIEQIAAGIPEDEALRSFGYYEPGPSRSRYDAAKINKEPK